MFYLRRMTCMKNGFEIDVFKLTAMRTSVMADVWFSWAASSERLEPRNAPATHELGTEWSQHTTGETASCCTRVKAQALET